VGGSQPNRFERFTASTALSGSTFFKPPALPEVADLILRGLYTGMQGKCLPIPQETNGKPAIHYTTIYKVFAKWADDGSLWQAFVASVRHLAAEKQLDLRVLHGDGTNTVAKKGAMALGSRGINTRRVTKSSRSSTTMVTS
jgi:hypothetical protein